MALAIKQLALIRKVSLKTDQKGFTVIEIIIALAIFLIIVPGILALLWNTQNSIDDANSSLEALDIAQSALDGLLVQSHSGFPNIKNYTTNAPPYQTTVNISDLDLYTKQIKVTVSWQTNPSRPRQVNLTGLATDAQSALTGNTCLVVPGGQNQPIINGILAFGAGNEPTGVITRGHLAFVTTDASSSGAADFFIVDTADPAHLATIASLNTGPGLSSIAIAGHYVYVGNTSINGQLQIIDISDPIHPSLKTTYKLPGSYNDNTTIANTITYNSHKVYLGTQKSQIAEFHIIDVNNIALPQELGSFEVNAGINAIAVSGPTTYVASPANEEIKALDTGDPGYIHQIGAFDAPGGSGNGKSLAIWNTNVFLGRTIGGNELYIIDGADPVHLKELNKQNLNASINNMSIIPSWLYLATTDNAKTLQIWSISPSTGLSLAKSLALNTKANGLACGLDKLYLITANGLTIITP